MFLNHKASAGTTEYVVTKMFQGRYQWYLQDSKLKLDSTNNIVISLEKQGLITKTNPTAVEKPATTDTPATDVEKPQKAQTKTNNKNKEVNNA